MLLICNVTGIDKEPKKVWEGIYYTKNQWVFNTPDLNERLVCGVKKLPKLHLAYLIGHYSYGLENETYGMYVVWTKPSEKGSAFFLNCGDGKLYKKNILEGIKYNQLYIA